MTDLYLESNELSGDLPSELGSLTALNELHMEDNQLSGPIPDELCAVLADPTFFCGLPSIELYVCGMKKSREASFTDGCVCLTTVDPKFAPTQDDGDDESGGKLIAQWEYFSTTVGDALEICESANYAPERVTSEVGRMVGFGEPRAETNCEANRLEIEDGSRLELPACYNRTVIRPFASRVYGKMSPQWKRVHVANPM